MFLLDLDELLQQANQAGEDNDRRFARDVFISHRQSDKPIEFIQRLKTCGVQVAWDLDLDLRDRRVIKAISRLMSTSYSLVLYVSSTFEDSLWCKAEYLSALQSEQDGAPTRVMVVLQNEQARERVPPVLSAAPCYLATDTDALVGVLLEGNSKVADPLKVSVSVLQLNEAVLSTEEILNLLEQRLEYWVESAGDLVNVGEDEKRLAYVLEHTGQPYTELEDILRDVKNCAVGRDEVYTRPLSIISLQRLVCIGQRVAHCLADDTASHSAAASRVWIYGLMLCPLLCAVLNDTTRQSALQVYESICQQLENSPEAVFVPVYRHVAERVVLDPENIENILLEAMVEYLPAYERPQ
ncbi:TIR domain-containing protein [Pseudomonas sp. 210_17 TE3656]